MSEPRDWPARPAQNAPLIELLPAAGGTYAPPPPERPRYGLALLLFALTFLTTTTLGPVMYLSARSDKFTDLAPFLFPEVLARVWGSPELLSIGLSFSLSALTILLAHEMGHYVACRRYGLPCTLPYFLPVPLNFGTFGAFIKIKAPIRSKRELFDVGIAGPLAGFVALVPFLVYGVAHSEILPPTAPGALPPGDVFLVGRCLAIEIAVRLFHGPIGEGMFLNLHPAALGAWLGLLATSLNLLPLGQLDGGHVLYAATGRLQRRLALPFWLGLALLGLYWQGWLLWCLIVLVIGLYHPPVYDEHTPLDPTRRKLAWVALLVFVLSFMPVPLTLVPLP
jgi:membrane-associated protease RseP (regulator of RpoE activity)